MKRVVTALPLVVMLIIVLEYLPPVFFAGLVAIVTFLAIEEYFQIAGKSEIVVFRWPGHLAAIGLIVTLYSFPLDARLLLTVLIVVTLTLLGLGLRRGDALQTVLAGVSTTVFGLIYVALSLGLLVMVRVFSSPLGAGNRWIFFGLLAVWFGDTGAYVAGKSMGRHKLAPSISPKKTLEGSLGGLAGSSLAAGVAHWILLPAVPWFSLLLLGWLLGIFAQIGDLAESAIKRGARVKDSSNLLPGHGGMLDRIDGVLFASPVLFIYTHWLLR